MGEQKIRNKPVRIYKTISIARESIYTIILIEGIGANKRSLFVQYIRYVGAHACVRYAEFR